MRFRFLAVAFLVVGVPTAMAVVGGGDVEFKVQGAARWCSATIAMWGLTSRPARIVMPGFSPPACNTSP